MIKIIGFLLVAMNILCAMEYEEVIVQEKCFYLATIQRCKCIALAARYNFVKFPQLLRYTENDTRNNYHMLSLSGKEYTLLKSDSRITLKARIQTED